MFYFVIKPQLNSPELLRVGVNSNYNRKNIHFRWNLFTIFKELKKKYLLYYCSVRSSDH